jgi:hypothetical protein
MRKLTLIVFLCVFSGSSFAQTIIFNLKQIRQNGSYCEMFFDIQNNTRQNITSMATYLLFRESSGSVIDSAMTGFVRIKPNSVTTDQVSLSNVNCGLVKSFQFKEVWGSVISIDGDQKYGRDVNAIVQGIQVKSSIGGVSARN